jgi:hypothetical protein
MSCGKLDNNGRVVSGSKLPCGTKLSYGVGKGTPKTTIVHLCAACTIEAPRRCQQHQTVDCDWCRATGGDETEEK